MENLNSIVRKNGRSYRLKNEQNKKAFFYPDEWLNFYSLLKERNKLCFDILINTGARINEARNITPADIDSNRATLHLRITKVRAREGEKRPVGRLIPISTEFKNRMMAYARNNNMKQDDTFKMLTTAQMNNLLKANGKLINKKEWNDLSAHNVRKTFENWLIALGIDPFTVFQHLGHKLSVAQTNYVSADVFTPNDKIMIRRILGDLYLK